MTTRCFFLPIILTLAFLKPVKAQDTSYTSPFTLGFGVGIYSSFHNTPNYYNGQSNNRLASVLSFRESDVRDALGGFNFVLEEYAQDMQYNLPAYFELQLGLDLNDKWSARINLLNAKLTATGQFTLRVERSNQTNPMEPVFELINISGTERRSHIELGLARRVNLNKLFYMVYEAGFNMGFIEVKDSRFRVGNQDFVIPFSPDPRNPAQTLTTYGSGPYGCIDTGLQLPSEYSLLMRLRYGYTKVDINDDVMDTGSLITLAVTFSKSF